MSLTLRHATVGLTNSELQGNVIRKFAAKRIMLFVGYKRPALGWTAQEVGRDSIGNISRRRPWVMKGLHVVIKIAFLRRIECDYRLTVLHALIPLRLASFHWNVRIEHRHRPWASTHQHTQCMSSCIPLPLHSTARRMLELA